MCSIANREFDAGDSIMQHALLVALSICCTFIEEQICLSCFRVKRAYCKMMHLL